tara:strand:+ start:180 stop:329 length:150 start_codon:yes stop_codon:yes gene_type:complete
LSVTVVGGEPRKCEQSKFTRGAQKKGVDEAFPTQHPDVGAHTIRATFLT